LIAIGNVIAITCQFGQIMSDLNFWTQNPSRSSKI